MTQILRQSTAVDVLIGPFVDSTDGYTAETAVSPTVSLSKNGQTLAAKSDVTTPVHDANGYYNCELDATDTNTVGTLILVVPGDATSLPVRHEFMVIEEPAYDRLYASGATATDTGIEETVDRIYAKTDTGISAEITAVSTLVSQVDTGMTETLDRAYAKADTGYASELAGLSAKLDTGVPISVWQESGSTYTDTGSLGNRIDKLVFDTGANELHADIRKVANVQIKGAGDTGLADTWRPVTEA